MPEQDASELVSKAQFAKRVGVSRQAVDQAWARSTKRPEPVYTGPRGVMLFNPDEMKTWWEERQKNLWSRSKRSTWPVTCEVTLEERDRIDALREPSEGRPSVLRRLALAGLALAEEERKKS